MKMDSKSKQENLKVIFDIVLADQDIQMLENIQPDVEHLLLQSCDLVRENRFKECLQNLQAAIDVTWEALNTGHWSLVPESERTVYSAASLLKVVALVRQFCLSSADNEDSIRCLHLAVRQADLGLLLGNAYREQLSTAANLLSQTISQQRRDDSKSELVQSQEPANVPKVRVSTTPIGILHCPSLETFSAQHFYPRKPVKLTGCMRHWPALGRWSPAHLARVAGARTVPVELGSRYSHADWSQRLMTLGEFVSRHVAPAPAPLPAGDRPVGYLAQHPLFDQVPELRRDIAVPDYCACSDERECEGEGEVDINAWFGPAGTVSPLHQDPKHNLLCQVVGSKRVVLYSACESDKLYPHEGHLLSNTAQLKKMAAIENFILCVPLVVPIGKIAFFKVDPEDPDFSSFPRYRDTSALICALDPGEMLYIPPSWWHHVRALETSFSVSFWWK